MPLIDALVTNFDNGINNRTQGSNIFGSMKQLDPTRFHNFFDDFDTSVPTADLWAVTGTNGVIGDANLLAGDGGLVTIATAGASADQLFLQPPITSFLLETGPSYFAARISLDDVLVSDIIVGLQQTAPALTPADGLFFRKSNGLATVDLVAAKNSVEVVLATVTTLVDDTFVELGFFWDGIDSVWASVDGAPVSRFTPGTSFPDDVILAPTMGVQANEAAVKTLTVDYVFAAKER